MAVGEHLPGLAVAFGAAAKLEHHVHPVEDIPAGERGGQTVRRKEGFTQDMGQALASSRHLVAALAR